MFFINYAGLMPEKTQQSTPKINNISSKEFIEKMKDTNVIVIDVRTPNEVNEGYIKGTKLFLNLYSNNFLGDIKKLDSSKTYLVYCRSGARSSSACQTMVDNGFKSIYNLIGGVNSWPQTLVKP